MICKFYNSPAGCRYGDYCRYYHPKPTGARHDQSTQSFRPPAPSIWRQTELSRQQESLSDGQELWGDQVPNAVNEIEDQLQETGQLPYSSIARLNTEGFTNNLKIAAEPKDEAATVPQIEICRFYLAGVCKFGSRCRYSHIDPSSSTEAEFNPSSSSIPVGGKIECGICIEPEPNALYGIMSHCNCKFCLTCIKNWRMEGIKVTHDNEQVR
jgi:hypothetical protein